jgi:hypothetical protein
MSVAPGVRAPAIPRAPKPLTADVVQAVGDLRVALLAASQGKASARCVGEARDALDEVLCPGILQPR